MKGKAPVGGWTAGALASLSRTWGAQSRPPVKSHHRISSAQAHKISGSSPIFPPLAHRRVTGYSHNCITARASTCTTVAPRVFNCLVSFWGPLFAEDILVFRVDFDDVICGRLGLRMNALDSQPSDVGAVHRSGKQGAMKTMKVCESEG
jgi:hypothetical protein